MIYSPLLSQFIDALRCLPGVGPKSAQRMALFLLQRARSKAQTLSEIIQQALEQLQPCAQCQNFTEQAICHLCSHPKRDASLLCIVESAADVLAIEQSACYRGHYFILHGHLSPLDGIGPKEIGIPKLRTRFQDAHLQEVILATNPTVEGEATAHYIADLAHHNAQLRITRIAHGIPMGSELDYVDSSTLTHALQARSLMVFATPSA